MNAPLAAAQFLLYLTLYRAGGLFMSFQWDILLLEVGAAAVALAHPVALASVEEPPRTPILLLRFVFFKLMFMSGAVKVQADCPTWLGLTACHYHFATQVGPGEGELLDGGRGGAGWPGSGPTAWLTRSARSASPRPLPGFCTPCRASS